MPKFIDIMSGKKNNINQHLSKDAVLAEAIRSVDLPPLESDGNVYEGLIQSIISQQISTKVAGILWHKFKASYGGVVPGPDEVSEMSIEDLRLHGFSRQKSSYIKNIGEYFLEESTAYNHWNELSDQSIVDQLTKIKGVGKWTVEMILIFVLERPDVFPETDYGIQMAMSDLYSLSFNKKGDLLSQMIKIADNWSPYRSYATRYLWTLLDNT